MPRNYSDAFNIHTKIADDEEKISELLACYPSVCCIYTEIGEAPNLRAVAKIYLLYIAATRRKQPTFGTSEQRGKVRSSSS